MRPVCFHKPCKIDPVDPAGSLDICEQKGSLFGTSCDDICTLSTSKPAAANISSATIRVEGSSSTTSTVLATMGASVFSWSSRRNSSDPGKFKLGSEKRSDLQGSPNARQMLLLVAKDSQ
jgi:hypothetical protein